MDVTVTYSGVRILRSFGDEGNLRAVDTVNISLIATSEYGSYRFRDVGADVVKESPGGTLTVSIVGQLPFDYAGVLTIDLDTGELVREPRFRGDWQTERACDALTAD
ncbi:hypothetical protein [Agromyces sp. ZXT2-3]|uniref:hypothetical protein n=1 Tax=Agromyces sp. ZXT2-3 TaxID=3461152 RepID=UPI004055224F